MKWHIPIPYSRPLLYQFYYNQWPGAWAIVSLINASYSGTARICQGGGGGAKPKERNDRIEGECGRRVPHGNEILFFKIRVWKQHFLPHALHAIIVGGGGRLCDVSYPLFFFFFFSFFYSNPPGEGMQVTVVQPFVKGGGGGRGQRVRKRFTPPMVGRIVKIRTCKRHFLAR